MAPESVSDPEDFLLNLIARGEDWVFAGDAPLFFEPDVTELEDEPE